MKRKGIQWNLAKPKTSLNQTDFTVLIQTDFTVLNQTDFTGLSQTKETLQS